MHRCSNWLGFGSSKPNMSRIPMKPSVACRTALFNAVMLLEPVPPARDTRKLIFPHNNSRQIIEINYSSIVTSISSFFFFSVIYSSRQESTRLVANTDIFFDTSLEKQWWNFFQSSIIVSTPGNYSLLPAELPIVDAC